MPNLTSEEIAALLAERADWRLDDASGAIVRDLEFPTFADAIAFISRVAPVADEHDHHPDLDIRYRRVKVALLSHDVGALTHRDRRMARLIDELV